VDEAGECRKIVEGFIHELAARLREAISRNERPPSLREVLLLASHYAESRGSCRASLDLAEEYQRVAKLALDFAMEALSRHMEALPGDAYASLSGMLTAYAVHVARLVAVIVDEAQRLGALSGMVLEAAEALVFASAARMFSVAALVKEMDSKELVDYMGRVKDVIDFFIAEENSYLKAFYWGLYGGGGDGEAAAGDTPEA